MATNPAGAGSTPWRFKVTRLSTGKTFDIELPASSAGSEAEAKEIVQRDIVKTYNGEADDFTLDCVSGPRR
jgi:hypothetical protein